MNFHDFRKMYQGKHFYIQNEKEIAYFYLKKVVDKKNILSEKILGLCYNCIVDMLYFTIPDYHTGVRKNHEMTIWEEAINDNKSIQRVPAITFKCLMKYYGT